MTRIASLANSSSRSISQPTDTDIAYWDQKRLGSHFRGHRFPNFRLAVSEGSPNVSEVAFLGSEGRHTLLSEADFNLSHSSARRLISTVRIVSPRAILSCWSGNMRVDGAGDFQNEEYACPLPNGRSGVICFIDDAYVVANPLRRIILRSSPQSLTIARLPMVCFFCVNHTAFKLCSI